MCPYSMYPSKLTSHINHTSDISKVNLWVFLFRDEWGNHEILILLNTRGLSNSIPSFKFAGWIMQYTTKIFPIYVVPPCHSYTLPKFRRYNKASLRQVIPLEILGKHQQRFTQGVWPRSSCSTCLICARVWPYAELARFTLLYRQNFTRL